MTPLAADLCQSCPLECRSASRFSFKCGNFGLMRHKLLSKAVTTKIPPATLAL